MGWGKDTIWGVIFNLIIGEKEVRTCNRKRSYDLLMKPNSSQFLMLMYLEEADG